MKHSQLSTLLLAFISLTLMSCSNTGPVTVVRTPASTIESNNIAGNREGSNLQVLTYGELDQIKSLDPLFALNTASQRMVQLIHEGLTGLDQNGRPVARLAVSWDVTSDSLTWVFTLRDDVFFHDATVFASGIGRRVTARDVYNTFQRMASGSVPPNAARLFTGSIIGFDAYFREQNEIYFEQDRMITEIQGIRVVDDRTIQFNLNHPDPAFLMKLASPFAVVYPVEAYANKRSAEEGEPVGTGPFVFEGSYGDTLHVLTRNRRYWEGSDSLRIDRVEVVNHRGEAELFKRFARQDIDFIAELGPDMIRTLINDNGDLEEAYTPDYVLYRGHPQPYELHFNPINAYLFDRKDALSVLRDFSIQRYTEQMGSKIVRQITLEGPFDTQGATDRLARFDTLRNMINLSYDGNHISGDFLLNIVQSSRNIAPMRIYRSPLVTREILFYMTQPDTFASNGLMELEATSTHQLMRFEMDRFAIMNKNVHGIQMNQYSWWLDFRGAAVHQKPS